MHPALGLLKALPATDTRTTHSPCCRLLCRASSLKGTHAPCLTWRSSLSPQARSLSHHSTISTQPLWLYGHCLWHDASIRMHKHQMIQLILMTERSPDHQQAYQVHPVLQAFGTTGRRELLYGARRELVPFLLYVNSAQANCSVIMP